jgi:hypothetical protein
MLEQLMGLIQDNSQDAIVKNPAIPNQYNNDAMQTVLQSVMGGLQNEAQGGNVGGLMSLLSGRGGQGGSDEQPDCSWNCPKRHWKFDGKIWPFQQCSG